MCNWPRARCYICRICDMTVCDSPFCVTSLRESPLHASMKHYVTIIQLLKAVFAERRLTSMERSLMCYHLQNRKSRECHCHSITSRLSTRRLLYVRGVHVTHETAIHIYFARYGLLFTARLQAVSSLARHASNGIVHHMLTNL